MASVQQQSATVAPKTNPPLHSLDASLHITGSPVEAPQHTSATPISPCQYMNPRKRRRVNRITRPQVGSLYDIMHEHSGKALFVLPICWTDRHAHLLDARFVERDAIQKPVPDLNHMSSKYPSRPTKVAALISNELTNILSPQVTPSRNISIKSVMGTFFPATLSKPKSDQELSLLCGNRIVRRAVRVGVLWKHPNTVGTSFDSVATKLAISPGLDAASGYWPWGSQTSDAINFGSQLAPKPPILAFIDKTYLDTVRQTLYRVAPGPANGDRTNVPVTSLQKLRAKELAPATRAHDAYLVAAMLAIAQSLCYAKSSSNRSSRSSSRSSSQSSTQGSTNEWLEPQANFRDVPIRILSQDANSAEFIVYNAIVRADLLRRFDDPSWAPCVEDLQSSGLEIKVTRVPVWPLLGLKERLAKALGEEIAGEACSRLPSTEIETWESEEERELRLSSLKRKRAAVPDDCNQSFSSDGSGTAARELSTSASVVSNLGTAVASPPVSPRTPKRKRTTTQTVSELEVC